MIYNGDELALDHRVLPDTDLQEQLPSARIENYSRFSVGATLGTTRPTKDSSIDRFCCQVSLESLVDRDTVDIRVVYEPNNLVTEEFGIILTVEVRLRRL